ncbi:hypothetical protein [Pontibacillus litoralis]|uniref:Uncharacterized protein n=1 Tax=Pontibacillus litoralis JSM 072002 TaxID=1385512 RepID=A0A0A5HXC1_9BACI|nr:hypothetical protein [Pontibacillus litoralis]KGX88272.1 hypothetical protein N784_10830 [Pontibacillus litoralis JSM 072002]
MDFERMSPYGLGESNSNEAIKYIVRYLQQGSEKDKGLAACAIRKLVVQYPAECAVAFPYLLQHIDSSNGELRENILEALLALPKNQLTITEDDIRKVNGGLLMIIGKSIVRSPVKLFNNGALHLLFQKGLRGTLYLRRKWQMR